MLRDELIAPGSASLQKLADLRQLTLIIYVLYAVTPLTAGLSGLIAVVINYLKRDEVHGTFYDSHFVWQIRLFWRTVLWLALGFATLPLYYLGLVVFLAGAGWYVYRLVKGLSHLSDGKALPL